jgi:hypothetical protein
MVLSSEKILKSEDNRAFKRNVFKSNCYEHRGTARRDLSDYKSQSKAWAPITMKSIGGQSCPDRWAEFAEKSCPFDENYFRMTFSFHSLSSLTSHRCFPASCTRGVGRSDQDRREYLDSFQGLMFDGFAEIERESFHSVTWIGASVSLAVAELHTGIWKAWNDEPTVPFCDAKVQKSKQKSQKSWIWFSGISLRAPNFWLCF